MISFNELMDLGPHDRFRWWIYGVVRKHAQFIFFDLFDDEFDRSVGHYFVLFIFGATCFGAGYGMLMHSNDLAYQLYLFGFVTGFIQVM